MKVVGKNILLEGIIIPVGWNNNGKTSEIALSTNGEQILAIIMDLKGLELLDFQQKLVRVNGDLIDDNGDSKIRILSFKTITAYSIQNM